jgi:alpha-tubulin suppressor-like RCC1 family protein
MYFTCALLGDKSIRCWGYNDDGQLGDGTSNPAGVPIANGVVGVTSLSSGYNHSCVALVDGSVTCWGVDGMYVPVAVANFSGAVEIVAGSGHTCARHTNGSLYCWGGNGSGQLGDGTTQARVSPTLVSW